MIRRTTRSTSTDTRFPYTTRFRSYVAGGVESMTRAPFVTAKSEGAWSRKSETHDTTIGWRFTNKKLAEKYFPYSMGETAENVARQWNRSEEHTSELQSLMRISYAVFCLKTKTKTKTTTNINN